ncbi:hypothetical protein CN495_07535 [Bacillus thuringiensis]|uniref:Uncharacterized protein n=1 Tax=Bacillus thuringiensis TaxID=1428 RepID=A0ABD6SMY5_BACTU|nr:hypothetical protein [Bacillus thuringiensis]PER55597.1 hypothetical protein CN495_07535 [Bacillus thuringiensis]
MAVREKKTGGGRLLFSLFVIFWVLLTGTWYLYGTMTETDKVEDTATALKDAYFMSKPVVYELVAVEELGEVMNLEQSKEKGLYAVSRNYQPYEDGKKYPIVGKTQEEGYQFKNIHRVRAIYKDENGKKQILNQPALVEYKNKKQVEEPLLVFKKLGNTNNPKVSGKLVNPTLVLQED